jgi:hypothetical protein
MRHKNRGRFETCARAGALVVLSPDEVAEIEEDLRALDDARDLIHRLSVQGAEKDAKITRAIADRDGALRARDEWARRANANAAEVQDTRWKAHEDILTVRQSLAEKDAEIARLRTEIASLAEYADARTRAEIMERQLQEERAMRRVAEGESQAARKALASLRKSLGEERQNVGAKIAEKDAEIARLRAQPPALPYFRCALPLDRDTLDFSHVAGITDGVLLAALRKVASTGRPAVLPVATARIIEGCLEERGALRASVYEALTALEKVTR